VAARSHADKRTAGGHSGGWRGVGAWCCKLRIPHPSQTDRLEPPRAFLTKAPIRPAHLSLALSYNPTSSIATKHRLLKDSPTSTLVSPSYLSILLYFSNNPPYILPTSPHATVSSTTPRTAFRSYRPPPLIPSSHRIESSLLPSSFIVVQHADLRQDPHWQE
jgi:hypothetical protein